MKKIFTVLIMAAAIFSVVQIAEPMTAHANDVWVASDERCQYYVMTETFKYRYADTKSFSIVVKTVWQDGSGDVNSPRWDFFYDDFAHHGQRLLRHHGKHSVAKSQSRLFELGYVSSGRD